MYSTVILVFPGAIFGKAKVTVLYVKPMFRALENNRISKTKFS